MLGFRARSASFKLIRVYNYHVITRSRVPEGVIIKKLVKADVVSYQVPFFRSHVFYLQIFSRVCPWFAPDVYCWSRSREFSIRYSMTESFWRLPKLSRQFMNLFAWGCKYFVIRCCVVSVLCWIWKKKRKNIHGQLIVKTETHVAVQLWLLPCLTQTQTIAISL